MKTTLNRETRMYFVFLPQENWTADPSNSGAY